MLTELKSSLHTVRGHCPNLVPSASEKQVRPRLRKATTFALSAKYGTEYQQDYKSLAAMWSTWNRDYFDADFPRLFVRFEDIIFNAEKVMHVVAACAGLSVNSPYRAMLEPSKDHGGSSSLLSAMIHYGTSAGRFDGMLPEDLEYAQVALDKELMQRFHYLGPELLQNGTSMLKENLKK